MPRKRTVETAEQRRMRQDRNTQAEQERATEVEKAVNVAVKRSIAKHGA